MYIFTDDGAMIFFRFIFSNKFVYALNYSPRMNCFTSFLSQANTILLFLSFASSSFFSSFLSFLKRKHRRIAPSHSAYIITRHRSFYFRFTDLHLHLINWNKSSSWLLFVFSHLLALLLPLPHLSYLLLAFQQHIGFRMLWDTQVTAKKTPKYVRISLTVRSLANLSCWYLCPTWWWTSRTYCSCST